VTSICTENISEGSGLCVIITSILRWRLCRLILSAEKFLTTSDDTLFTFAVQNMPKRRDTVSAAEVRFQQVAFDEDEAIRAHQIFE